jgi:hypothetical protein
MALYAIGWPAEAKRPTDPADRRLADAQRAAIQLLRDGLIELTRAEPLHGSRGSESLHPVAADLSEAILRDGDNWGSGDPEADARRREPHFELGATDSGTQAWLTYAKANGLIGFTKFDRVARRTPKPGQAESPKPD